MVRPIAQRTLFGCIGRSDGHVALMDAGGERTVSYEQLHAETETLARSLAGAGVGPGDAVAMVLPNAPELVLAFIATLRAGAAAAPLNPSYTRQELELYLEDLAPAAMLVAPGEGAAAREACAVRGIPVHELGPDGIAGLAPRGELPAADPDATALVLHTSGTTSKPKGVFLRQRNLAYSTDTIAAGYALGEEDVSYCVMPLFHVHGLVASTLSTLASGGTVVIPARFAAGRFWKDVARWDATWSSAVPTMWRALAVHPASEGPVPEHRLRFARSCSSALPTALMATFEESFGVPLVEAYGMTEAAHQMTSNPLPPGERRPGSVGLATGIEIATLDDDWNVLPAGASGEVAVRGPSVVDEYRGNPDATATAFRDGWFRTGDRGVLGEDGYLTLAGRVKELINRGGEKISPFEVEEALLAHPAVAEAVAFAAPDEKFGEQVAAIVVASPGSTVDVKALASHCGDRLAAFKVPKRIVVADAIPKGPTGKVQRRHLAATLDA